MSTFEKMYANYGQRFVNSHSPFAFNSAPPAEWILFEHLLHVLVPRHVTQIQRSNLFKN